MHVITTTNRPTCNDSPRRAWERRMQVYLYLAVLPLFLFLLAITDAAAQTQLDFAGEESFEVAGAGPSDIVVGDFDDDGALDLAITSFDGDGKVTVLLGNGTGTFADDRPFTVTFNAAGLAQGDFDADAAGALDLAVIGLSGSAQTPQVRIYLGNPSGEFASEPTILSAVGVPRAVVAEDFDEDGKLDLAVASGGGAGVSLFVGAGDGTFATGVQIPGTRLLSPNDIVTADFNRDTHADLAIPQGVYLGDGNGAFTRSSTHGGHAAGDVNGDGELDLVSATGSMIVVWLGDGAGDFDFGSFRDLGTDARLNGVALANVDLVGGLDVIVADRNADSVLVFLSNGDGQLSDPQSFDTGPEPMAVTAGDWNNDGLPDIAAPYRNLGDTAMVSVLLQLTAVNVVTVPDVVGLTRAAADTAITDASLAVGTITSENSNTVPAGNVIRHSPAAGDSVAQGTAVDLVVSSAAPAPVAVPDVMGQTQSAAEAALVAAGLSVGTLTTQNDAAATGTVLSQSPTGGAEVAPGSAVALVVSAGPAPVAVPDVVGQAQSAAEAALVAAGLSVGTLTTQNDAAATGTVLGQSPTGGAEVAPGSAVALTVSSGPGNRAPVADAGLDQKAFVGDEMMLDGSGSSDADADALTYRWSLAVPAESNATLSDTTAVMPTFTVDLPGTYVAELIVNDGTADSGSDTVSVSASSSAALIDPQVQIAARCAAPDLELAVIVTFTGDIDVADSELQTTFENLGATDMVVLTIINSIAATVPATAIAEIAALAGAENIRLDRQVRLPPPPGLPEPVTFAPPLEVDLGVHGVESPLLADFNDDGLPDALVPYTDDAGAHIGIYANESEPPFADQRSTFVGASSGPVGLGDFNEDSVLDLVVGAPGERSDALTADNVCGGDLDALPVLLGDGDGLFELASCLVLETAAGATAGSIDGIAVADFNEDCHEDIAITRSGDAATGYVAMFFGNGDGTFSELEMIGGFNWLGAIFAEYVDGDAHIDVVLTDEGRSAVYAGNGQGDFSFLNHDPHGPERIVGDINDDKRSDLLAYDPSGNELTVLIGNGDGGFTARQVLVIEEAKGPEGVGSLGDRVWSDTNGNGVPNQGELGIGGVILTLRDGQGIELGTTMTDEGGNYRFFGLIAGKYTVEVGLTTLPEGAIPTSDGDGIDTPHTSTTPLQAGDKLTKQDFGYRLPPGTNLAGRFDSDFEPQPISFAADAGIIGPRFVDLNGDEHQDLILLSESAQAVYVFFGNSSGNFLVPPQLIPIEAGLRPVGVAVDDVDNDDHRDLFVVYDNGDATATALLLLQSKPEVGSLGDRVWSDTNGNGVPNQDESGIGGVILRLLDGQGRGLGTTMTDEDGNYRFSDLITGEYTVEVGVPTLPEGAIPTFDGDGIDTPHTSTTPLQAGGKLTNQDFGYRLP